MKRSKFTRVLAGLLAVVMVLVCLPTAGAAQAGQFVLAVVTQEQVLVEPETVSYGPGDTVRTALKNSGHSFEAVSYTHLPSEAMTTTQARREVQSLLDACLTYDEAAVMSTGGKPFLEYLLTVNPRGYSVQYATLATLLMRCCGIPARYVEGYLLSGSKIEEAEPGQTLVLTQSDSHAWAEDVYKRQPPPRAAAWNPIPPGRRRNRRKRRSLRRRRSPRKKRSLRRKRNPRKRRGLRRRRNCRRKLRRRR